MKASKAVLLVFLIELFLCLVNTQPVKPQSSGTIYIRADGSVEGTDKIQRDGNVYTFTDNIYDSIVVERDNIVVDGAGYTLRGDGGVAGIRLENRRNVTIKNMQISHFGNGIELMGDGSQNNTIVGNNITDNGLATYGYGIWLAFGGSNNTIHENNIIGNWMGVFVYMSGNDIISENSITANRVGVWLYGVNTSVIRNDIVNNNGSGVWDSIGSNIVHHNNFVNNTVQADIDEPVVSIWDDGYLSGGNYWSDYEERYPNATEIDGSGIWDTPYVIDENNQDNYPLMDEEGKFEPYISTFHLLFEDRSHKLLGNLSAELRITEPEKEIIHSVCKLSLSSPRLDEYHEPYIDKVELVIAWTFIISGPYPISIYPPSPEKVTLHVDEEIILFERSRNVSDFVEEPRVVTWFREEKIEHHKWWPPSLCPTIRVYFSDGQEWEWTYEDNGTLNFTLWPEMDVDLSELSGKIETETITFTTVKKGYPIIITRIRVVILASIIVAIAVAAVIVKYRKKQ